MRDRKEIKRIFKVDGVYIIQAAVVQELKNFKCQQDSERTDGPQSSNREEKKRVLRNDQKRTRQIKEYKARSRIQDIKTSRIQDTKSDKVSGGKQATEQRRTKSL